MTRFVGPFRASFAAALLGLSVSMLLTGCTKSMTFPSASVAPTYNDSPIQLTAGQFRPVVYVSEVQDNRSSHVAGAVGSVTFMSDQGIRQFVHREMEGLLSNGGVPLGRSQADARSQSNETREVAIHIRSTSYGGATSMLHDTAAGVNLLVKVNDQSGRPVFAETYFGSVNRRVRATPERSGELMAQAVDQALRDAFKDGRFRAAVGL